MNSKPRLLFVSNLFPDATEPYRGLDNVTVLHHLRDRWDIQVIALRPSLRSWLGRSREWTLRPIDECFNPIFLEAPYVPKFGSRFNHQLMQRRLAPVLRSHSADVVLAAWLYPDAWAVTQSAEKPCVLIAQGSDVHRYLKDSARRATILEAVGKASATITRSRSLATLLAEAGADSSRLHPIHNGVDTSMFHPGAPSEARTHLGLGSEEHIVLFVGNLLPVKNPHLLLRAFAELPADSRLVLAGKGPLRAELEALATELGIASRTRFLGPQTATQIATWMRAADVLCMTSHNEGLPNVVLEARACGLPVVATNVGGIHEVIDAAAKGLLTPPGELAPMVKALLAHPPPSQPACNLSWQHTADAYHAVLESSRHR